LRMAAAHHDGSQHDVGSGGDPMYWLMPAGAVVGVVVIVAFERLCARRSDRKATYRSLARKGDAGSVDVDVERKLMASVNSLENVVHFWSGGSVSSVSKEQLTKTYEMLALVSALMLSVCVTFYTSSSKSDYLYGIVCCLANCSLWMAVLSAALFAIVIHSTNESSVQMLIGLYGSFLLRLPMLLLVWGLLMLFLVFILFFKLHIDPYFHCSLCLGGCFVIAPLFFHCVHKIGWARAVVIAHEAAELRDAHAPTLADLNEILNAYVKGRRGNVLALDLSDFMLFMESHRELTFGSVSREVAKRLFDERVRGMLEEQEKTQNRIVIPSCRFVISQ